MPIMQLPLPTVHFGNVFDFSRRRFCHCRFFPPTVLLLLPIFPADGFVTATFFCVAASTVRLQATSFAYSAFWILI
jgi:hypothetical protein